MTKDHIQLLFGYHYWALNHLVNSLLRLPPEQVVIASPHFYHGTAFQTVLHILDVDWSWLQMCKGNPQTKYLWEVETLPDLKAAHEFLAHEEMRMMDYLRELCDIELTAKIELGTAKHQEEQWCILLHIINHGTEHRTEIGHYLTECGNSPGELGFMYYLRKVLNGE